MRGADARRSGRQACPRPQDGGQPPYGFTVAEDGKTLVPNAEEQAVLDRIAELRATGASLRAIVRHLEDEGFTTRSGTWKLGWLQRMTQRLAKEAA